MTRSPWHKTLTSTLFSLARWLWPPTSEQQERDYQARLVRELHIRQQLLVDLCRRMERWRDRLEQLQRHETRLDNQCLDNETERSVRALERVRQVQGRIRDRLQRAERKYQNAQLRFEQLKRERTRPSLTDHC